MPSKRSEAANDQAYDFEKARDTQRKKHKAEEAAKKFLKRLETKADGRDVKLDYFEHEDQITILTFMTESVLNIDWYTDKIKKEDKKYWFFCFVSFGLLLTLPIVLYYFSTNLAAINQSLNAAGFIVAILSSIIAFYKAFAVWFKTRLRRGEFWRAMSRIKEILYQLEGKYRSLAIKKVEKQGMGKLPIEFTNAVLEATDECRRVASDEQQKFFDQQTLPDFELGKTLASAKTEAISLISSGAPPAFKPNKS